MQLVGNRYALRTVRHTFATAYAMARLAQFRHTAVVAYEVDATRSSIVAIVAAIDHISFVQALIVVRKNCRNVDAVSTWHTVLTSRARHEREFGKLRSIFFEQSEFFVGAGVERRVGTDVVLQMFHISHAAEYGQHARERAAKTERPRSKAVVGTPALEALNQEFRH